MFALSCVSLFSLAALPDSSLPSHPDPATPPKKPTKSNHASALASMTPSVLPNCFLFLFVLSFSSFSSSLFYLHPSLCFLSNPVVDSNHTTYASSTLNCPGQNINLFTFLSLDRILFNHEVHNSRCYHCGPSGYGPVPAPSVLSAPMWCKLK